MQIYAHNHVYKHTQTNAHSPRIGTQKYFGCEFCIHKQTKRKKTSQSKTFPGVLSTDLMFLCCGITPDIKLICRIQSSTATL